jgi:pimeloyl-ACP methyl ester carboxylesterase
MSNIRTTRVPVGASSLHLVEAGDPDAPPFLFLHGWPESSRAWQPLMTVAAGRIRAIAVDLPGIGESAGVKTDGTTAQIAEVVHQVIEALELRDLTLVGHDVGGMVVHSYLRRYRNLTRAVIMNVVIPGLGPWEEVLRNPYIWHFAFHSVRDLPERLVAGRQADYFAFFYDYLTTSRTAIPAAAREAYSSAYASEEALRAGFDWYRAFPRDAEANREGARVAVPLLYVRGEKEGGRIEDYVKGFTDSGVEYVSSRLIPGVGHFPHEEAPLETWQALAEFAGIAL